MSVLVTCKFDKDPINNDVLPGVLGNRERGHLFQGNKGTKQRQFWVTGNI